MLPRCRLEGSLETRTNSLDKSGATTRNELSQYQVGQNIPKFIGKMFTFLNDAYHRDIGTPESLQTAEREYPWYPPA